MNCDEALLAISAALDGELLPAERAKLSEHLMSCEDCRELAEDLRVLTEELGRSDREVPQSLAESVRRAVAEEPQASPATKKRRAPYLRAVAAMLALCAGLGGISLFASGRMRGDSAGGVSPALFQAAPENAGGGPAADDEGEPAPMEAAQAPESPAPMPATAPAGMAEDGDGNHKETRESGGYTSGSGPSSEQYEETCDKSGCYAAAAPGNSTAALTPEEALELVFQHLGGREAYPEAEQLLDGSTSAYYLQTVETDQVSSAYYLDYYGLYEDGRSHWFRYYEDVTEKQTDIPGHEATLNWYTVSPDGQVTAEFPE